VIPADSPVAQKFIGERAARREPRDESGRAPLRAEATGKVLGRALAKLFRK